MIIEYLSRVSRRRLCVMLIGNIIIGLGVAVFKLSQMGNDPFSGMMMALSAAFGISYPLFQVLLNAVFFLIQLWLGRRLIGAGTVVNAVFLGYFADFFYKLLTMRLAPPTQFCWQILLVLAGVIICSLGLSLYQQSDVGVAPYDSLALILHEHACKVSYFWCRMLIDALAALICYLAGGIVGLGTLASAFGLGPFIQFFNTHLTNKILPVKEAAK